MRGLNRWEVFVTKLVDQLKSLMIEHFANGASAWRIRQTLVQCSHLGKEPTCVRTHCARLNWPTSESIHYFVQGLKPKIREYVSYFTT